MLRYVIIRTIGALWPDLVVPRKLRFVVTIECKAPVSPVNCKIIVISLCVPVDWICK